MTAIAYGPGSPGLRLDLVIRTSKRKAEAKSPKQQRDMAMACAAMFGYTIVAVHDSKADESGKTMDRASLRSVMQRKRDGLTDGAIVALTDRLGRAPIEEAMTWVRELWAVGGALVPADAGGRPVDLSDPQAETNLVLQLQIARQFWLSTARRFKHTQTDAIKAGKWIGRAPLGYEKVKTKGERKGCLKPAEHHADQMAHAYRLAGTDGLHAAQSYLEARYPGRFITTDHVRRVLRSRVYRGEVHYKGFEPNLMAHEPIVTEAEWKAAQTKPRHRAASGNYPLTHKMHCGRCGSGMVGAMQTVPTMKRDPADKRKWIKDDSKPPRKYRRYRCSNTACKGGTSIRAEVVEGFVLTVMQHALTTDEFRLGLAPDGLAEAERAMAAAGTEVARYNADTEIRELLGDDRWREGMRERVAAERRAIEAWRAIADRAGHAEDLPGPEQLTDPVHFERALNAVLTVARIVVAPGRGAVADRVSFPALDERDHVARILSA